MDNSTTKTKVTFKVVSTLKRLEVSDVLGVDVRKDVKKVSKLLGKANGGGSSVTNTYSTRLNSMVALDDIADERIRESRLDMVAGIVKWLDSQDSHQLRERVERFHKVVASEKRKLHEEYGATTIPAERYKQYLDACREVSVSVWVTQLVVTKVSPTYFEGGVLNSESKLYHATVKTKTVYTSSPITEDYMISQEVVKPEEREVEYTDEKGVSRKEKVRICVFTKHGKHGVSDFEKRASGSAEIAYVFDKRTGEKILVLRRRTQTEIV